MRTRDPRSGGAQGMDGRYNSRRTWASRTWKRVEDREGGCVGVGLRFEVGVEVRVEVDVEVVERLVVRVGVAVELRVRVGVGVGVAVGVGLRVALGVVDDRRAEVRGQRKPSNYPRNKQNNPGAPTTGHR